MSPPPLFSTFFSFAMGSPFLAKFFTYAPVSLFARVMPILSRPVVLLVPLRIVAMQCSLCLTG